MKLCGLRLKSRAIFVVSFMNLEKLSFDPKLDFSQFCLLENLSMKERMEFKGSGKISLKSFIAIGLIVCGRVLSELPEFAKEFLTRLTVLIAVLILGTNSNHLSLFSGKSHGLFSFRQRIFEL